MSVQPSHSAASALGMNSRRKPSLAAAGAARRPAPALAPEPSQSYHRIRRRHCRLVSELALRRITHAQRGLATERSAGLEPALDVGKLSSRLQVGAPSAVCEWFGLSRIQAVETYEPTAETLRPPRDTPAGVLSNRSRFSDRLSAARPCVAPFFSCISCVPWFALSPGYA